MSSRPDNDDSEFDDEEYEEIEYEEGEEHEDDDFLEDDDEYEYIYEDEEEDDELGEEEENEEESFEEATSGAGFRGGGLEEQDDEAPEAPVPAEVQSEGPPSLFSRLFSSLSRGDTIWLGALALVFLAMVIGGLSMFFKNIETSGSPGTIEFPIEGQFAKIVDIETFWRKPDRNREIDRGVKLDVKLIPGAILELHPESSAGAIRVFFEDPRGELVGDPVTHSFSDGKFRTGENKIELNSTGGFNDEGEYAAYLTEEVHFWYLVVKEGPGPNAAGYEFKELLRLRISHKRL